MTAKARPLTPEQKKTIMNNRDKFPADIARLEGMAGTTPRQISDYLRQHPDGTPNPHADLADAIENYIRQYGLPSKHGGVIEYIKHLRKMS